MDTGTVFTVNGLEPEWKTIENTPNGVPTTSSTQEEDDDDQRDTRKRQLLYRVSENCPLHLGIVYGFQQLAESAAGLVGLVALMQRSLCGNPDGGTDADNVKFAELMNAMLIVTGFSTIFEICLGFRLPVMEGVSYSFLAPIVAMQYLPAYECLPACKDINATIVNNVTGEFPRCDDNAFESRMREVAGSVMCAGLAQMLLGATGGIGFLLNYISSLTVAVTVMLLGIGFFESVANRASNFWPASLLTVSMYVLFALLLSEVRVPLPAFNFKKKFHFNYYPIFRLFPSLLAIGVGWLFCFILTESGALTDNTDADSYKARTDTKTGVLEKAEWFIIPYPGIIGMPTFGLGLFIGFLASVTTSTFESLGDYYNIARACEVPMPPKHAVNRGIAVEGLCSMLSGSIGGCLGTTTYSDVAGLIPVTGMASRMGWLMVGVVYLVAGVMGKVTAAISLCPDPVIAGFNIFSFGMIATMGLSHLQNVDLKSVRNLVILAVSIMIGLSVPYWAKSNIDDLDTGNKDANQVIQILLTSYMFVGGVTTVILDNLVPGTRKERGILAFVGVNASQAKEPAYIEKLDDAYGLPFITKWMRRRRMLAYVPFLPPYDDQLLNVCGDRDRKACCCR